MAAAEQVGQEAEAVAELLTAGGQRGHQDRLSVSTGDRAVAAPDLAIHRGWAHGLLRAVIGRVDSGNLQEGEQLVVMFGQVLGQSLVVWVGLGPIQHSIPSALQSPDGDEQAVRGQFAVVPAIAEGQGVAQQTSDLGREAGRWADGGLQQFLAASAQVGKALLVGGEDESVIGRPSVVNHRSDILGPDDRLGHLVAASDGDVIDRSERGDKSVHPCQATADPPAGLVGHDPGGLRHGGEDLLVDRLAPPGGPLHRLAYARGGDADAKEGPKERGDLAVRKTGLLVEMHDGGLGVRSQLTGGRSNRVGGLQPMPWLNAFAATAAMADMNVESTKDGPARNLRLELLGLAILGDLPAAIGAMVRQGNVDDFVGLSAGNLAVGLGAVILSGLAPGVAGGSLGGPLENGAA